MRLKTATSAREYWLGCQSSLDDGPPVFRGSDQDFVSGLCDIEGWANETSNPFEALTEHIVPESSPQSETLIVAEPAPSCIVGAMLARRLSAQFQLVPSFRDKVVEYNSTAQRRALFVGQATQITDELLTELLDVNERRLATGRPPDQCLPIGVLCAGSIGDLSHYVATLLADNRVVKARLRTSRFVSIRPGGSTPSISTLEVDEFRGSSAPLTLENSTRACMAGSSILAVNSHGFDGCARGGNELVFCGRYPEVVAADINGKQLGCAASARCPRGPNPLPLAKVAAEILFMNTCNSLRLADSVLSPMFNLALSYLSNSSGAYVGSVISVSEESGLAVVFLAAMKEGYSVGAGVSLTNAFLIENNIDRPAILSVGPPDMTCMQQTPSTVDVQSRLQVGAKAVRVNATQMNAICIRSDNEDLIVSKEQGTLELTLRSTHEHATWLCRIEKADCGKKFLHVYVFSFPHTLECLDIECNTSGYHLRRAKKAVSALLFWNELSRSLSLTSLDIPDREIKELIAAAGSNARYDEKACADTNNARMKLLDTARELRQQCLAELKVRLEGGFWLSSVLSSSMRFRSAVNAKCPNCGGAAQIKTLVELRSDETSELTTCFRCGMVREIPSRFPAQRITVDGPECLKLGSRHKITVAFDTLEGAAIDVMAVISAHNSGPTDIRCTQQHRDGSRTEREFCFQLPAHFPKHQCTLKVILATDTQIALAARISHMV